MERRDLGRQRRHPRGAAPRTRPRSRPGPKPSSPPSNVRGVAPPVTSPTRRAIAGSSRGLPGSPPSSSAAGRSDGAGYRRVMTIVDDLLAKPGLYIGVDRLAGSDHTGVARIVVTTLPGGSGVTLDYDVVNVADAGERPKPRRAHDDRPHPWRRRGHGGRPSPRRFRRRASGDRTRRVRTRRRAGGVSDEGRGVGTGAGADSPFVVVRTSRRRRGGARRLRRHTAA